MDVTPAGIVGKVTTIENCETYFTMAPLPLPPAHAKFTVEVGWKPPPSRLMEYGGGWMFVPGLVCGIENSEYETMLGTVSIGTVSALLTVGSGAPPAQLVGTAIVFFTTYTVAL